MDSFRASNYSTICVLCILGTDQHGISACASLSFHTIVSEAVLLSLASIIDHHSIMAINNVAHL